MSAKEQILNRIDKFLLGRMNDTEAREFRAELTQNEILAKDYNLRKLQIGGIESYARKNLKAQLKVIHNKIEADTSRQTPVNNTTQRVLIIILLLCLSALGYYVWHKTTPQKIEPTQLFADNFKPYKASNRRDVKSNKDSIDIKMLLSYKLYSENRFAEATPVFESLINEHSLVLSELNLMLGISYRKSGELKKSQEIFLDIIKRDDINFKDEATWQLAISYLQEKNIVKSKEYFKILAIDEDADHHEESKIQLQHLQQ